MDFGLFCNKSILVAFRCKDDRFKSLANSLKYSLQNESYKEESPECFRHALFVLYYNNSAIKHWCRHSRWLEPVWGKFFIEILWRFTLGFVSS